MSSIVAGQRADGSPLRGAQAVTTVLALLLAAGVLGLLTASLVAAGDLATRPWTLILLPTIWLVPGTLLAVGRRSSPLGWLMISLAAGLAGIAFAEVWLGAGRSAGAAWAVWYVDRASAIVVPIGLVILLLLPDGRLPSPGWRPIAVSVVGVQVVTVILWSLAAGPAAAPGTEHAGVGELPNPVGVLPGVLAARLVGLDFWLLQLPLLLGVAAVIHRLLRHQGDDRERLAAVLGSAATFALLAVVGRALWPGAADLLDLVGSALLAASLCSAVLRRRLRGVDLIVSYALAYSILTVALAATYAVAVATLGQLGRSLPPFGLGVLTAVVALTLLPLRGRLQRLLDRMLYGDTHVPGRAVQRLSHEVAGSTSAEAVLAGLARTVSLSLRVPWVLVEAGGMRIEHGIARAGFEVRHTVQLRADGLTLGSVTICPGPGRGFRKRDNQTMAELVDHGARALRAVQLADELRASRQQLVVGREDERARLRRDLHDEIGPSLASLSMQLPGLAELIRTDPATAVERVGRLGAIAEDALHQVRRLARDLRPPALDELGLVGALAQSAADLGLEPVISDGLPAEGLPASVEVGAYRIGVEALSNVARHSGDQHPALRVSWDAAVLTLSVVDHGRGWAASAAGVGMVAMRERAEELDGTLIRAETPGGGATLLARIPLPDPDRVSR